ncbi:hypothetical protein LOTGIDRAFT_114172 [Lottia gigantea]|uniref:non-specific serine/threonine protein kinase n=1 Tax=Lottia gigantea TaxID=225164 RepID=V4A4B0_LOTGI|nr:hypothetical protein LOTGIDRAFT_114172 [Lottia gigantea]ESO98753.1 hypothetical protein LOTGIDRAFT_114172 [Lottia gigantea]
MGKVTLTQDSYIRKLPFSAYRKLINLLDPGREWEKMAVLVPREINMTADNFEPRYDFDQIANFAERGRKHNGSATESILRDWGTQNPTIQHLINVFMEAELFAAADYLSVQILGGSPVPRPHTDFMSVENNLGRPHRKVVEDDEDLMLDGVNLPKPNSSKASDNEEMKNSVLRDHNIVLRHVSYSTLKSITNNFNEEEAIKGGNLLGKGGFGLVFLGKFQSNFSVAVKQLKKDSQDIDVEKQFNTERHYLTKYRQDNLVQLLGFSHDGPYNCLIYQLMTNGSLEDRLMCKDGTSPLTSSQRVIIVKGTAEGIAFLNNHGLVHRDIKSANVLLDEKFLPKIADFATTRSAPQGSGLSKVQQTSCVIGTSAYLAPEAFQYDVSTKLDSFSFGVVLYEILTGLPAYDDQREEKDLKTHMDENCEQIVDMLDISGGEWDEKAVNVIYDVAVQCVQNKRRRPVVSDLLEDLRKL